MGNSRFAPTGQPMTEEEILMDIKMNDAGIRVMKNPPKTLGEYIKQIDERVKRLEENSTKPFVYPR